MVSISCAVDQIKKNPSQALACLAVRRICQDLGVRFRQRALDPATPAASNRA